MNKSYVKAYKMRPFKKYVTRKMACFEPPSPSFSHFVTFLTNIGRETSLCHSFKINRLWNDLDEFSFIHLSAYANHAKSKQAEGLKSHFNYYPDSFLHIC